MHVLLAEDNLTNQMVAMQMLESLGAIVTVANDGLEALEILAERTFDVALIDIEMPRLSGIDLIRQVRSDGTNHADMPMIALTAYVMREHRAAIDTAGADGIIAKPILSIEQFGIDIRAIIERREESRNEAAGRTEPQAPPMPDQPAIDEEIFGQLCATFDRERLPELLGKVRTDIANGCASVRTAVENGDMSQLRAATHVLIAVAGAIGALGLQNLSQRLNSAGHASDKLAIERDAPELISEASRVIEQIDIGAEGVVA